MVGVEQLIASDIERGRFCGDGSCWHDDDLYIMSRMLRFTGVKTYTGRIQRERLITRTAHLHISLSALSRLPMVLHCPHTGADLGENLTTTIFSPSDRITDLLLRNSLISILLIRNSLISILLSVRRKA